LAYDLISENDRTLWAADRDGSIPRPIAGALNALRFDRPSTAILDSLDERGWKQVLSFCDKARLTLLLGQLCRESLPEWVAHRIDGNLAHNTERAERLKQAFFQIADRLDRDRAQHLALRGITHWKDYVPDPRLRCQYDIDLFCPSESLLTARDALADLGYEPLEEMEGFPTDHLPSMIRKTGWEWRGDFFDPEIPFGVDLHFRLWDETTERFVAPGVEEFWARRVSQCVDGRTIPCLHPVDALGSASLHLLRHLLRSALQPFQVYEIAYFLHTHGQDAPFWRAWLEMHPARLRQLEAICFRLASEWFGCALPEAAREEVEALQAPVRLWFDEYSASPLEALFRPNKNELWLHFGLIESARDRRKVLVRRLLPARMPGPVDAVLIPDDRMTWQRRLRSSLKYAAYVASRAAIHLGALPSVLWGGTRWWLRASGITRTFWLLLGVSALVDLGLSIFFLLYNLYLLDLGFKEDFLGSVIGAMTAGNIVGTLPAGVLGRRLGLRNALVLCVTGAAIVSGSRALVSGRASLLVLAFLDGLFTSIWAVSYVPAVAQSAGSEQRPLAFSLFTVEGIAAGVFAGLLGGWMPGWLIHAGIARSPVAAERAALLAGCAMTLAAMPLARRLHFPAPAAVPGKTVYPRGAFIVRFLIAIGVWNLATGAFNPFFNAYFARYLHTGVARIGAIYAGGQLAQVVALLAAPLILRKFGKAGGITGMMLATGIALGALAVGRLRPAAGMVYAGYMAFQWMSEPGLYSLLMDHVPGEQQSGASSLNFLTIFSVNAIAAAAAGSGFTHYGYPTVLAVAAGVAVAGAFLFRELLGGFDVCESVHRDNV
jgi:MFS family permease